MKISCTKCLELLKLLDLECLKPGKLCSEEKLKEELTQTFVFHNRIEQEQLYECVNYLIENYKCYYKMKKYAQEIEDYAILLVFTQN